MRLLPLAFLALTSGAQAVIIQGTANWSAVPSVDGLRDPDNHVANLDWQGYYFGNQYRNFRVIGYRLTATLAAAPPSEFRDFRLSIEDTAMSNGLILMPAYEVRGNSGFYQVGPHEMVDLRKYGMDFPLGPDGVMRFEFWEAYNDSPNAPDGFWINGSMDFLFEAEPVPEPATLSALGLGALPFVRRRRR